MTFVLDTNILVYSVDANEPDKRAQATALLQHLGGTNQAVLSAQMLAEFAKAAMRRLQPPLPPDQTYWQVERYEQAFLVIPLTPAIVEVVVVVRDPNLCAFGHSTLVGGLIHHQGQGLTACQAGSSMTPSG